MYMQMPILDGYEATQILRNALDHGPIVALTAHAMAEDWERYLRPGCYDFLSKPIARERLFATIDKVMPPPNAG